METFNAQEGLNALEQIITRNSVARDAIDLALKNAILAAQCLDGDYLVQEEMAIIINAVQILELIETSAEALYAYAWERYAE